jgi:hypothetical protein
VLLKQSDVGDNEWALTGLSLHVTYRILLVKSGSDQVTEEMTHYAPVSPKLNYKDAINLLKKYDPITATYTP